MASFSPFYPLLLFLLTLWASAEGTMYAARASGCAADMSARSSERRAPAVCGGGIAKVWERAVVWSGAERRRRSGEKDARSRCRSIKAPQRERGGKSERVRVRERRKRRAKET